MLSATLQPKQDSNPYQLLQEIFEETNIRYMRYHNWRWFRSVLEYKPYQFMGAPVGLLSSWNLLVKMIGVADLLVEREDTLHCEDSRHCQDTHHSQDTLQCEGLEMLHADTHQSGGDDGQTTAALSDQAFMKGLWDLYDDYNGEVIHLFKAETDEPRLFFQRFFKQRTKAEWFGLLDDWLEYGLDKVGMAEFGGAVDEMPEALELLQGLCEACWLLHKAYQEADPADGSQTYCGEIRTTSEVTGVETSGLVAQENSFVAACQSSRQNSSKAEEALASISSVFTDTDLDDLQFDLWNWFRSSFEQKPYHFNGDPSWLLYVKRWLEAMMAAAQDLLPDSTIIDLTASDKHRLRSYSAICREYDGLVRRLTLDETQMPALFFRRFFAFRNQEQWLELLEEWLEYGLSKSSIRDYTHVDELPEALELLEGLCEACWLLHKDYKESKQAERPAEPWDGETEKRSESNRSSPDESTNAANNGEPQQLCVETRNASCNDEELAAIIGMINASMDVEKVFLLGRFASVPAELGAVYDLLVLVKDGINRPMDELESFIRNRSEELSPVHATVMKMSKLNDLLKNGNWYFHHCCSAANLVYDAGSIQLLHREQVLAPAATAMDAHYDPMLAKAEGFLAGARHYHESGEYALAAFSLHQAMEHGINAVLVPLMQFRFRTHSLHKLLCFVRRISPSLYDLFPRNTEAEQTLFQLLQKAYIHARYKDSFAVSGEQSAVLLERVGAFLEQVPVVYGEVKLGMPGE
jgi:HEPN domain-containing protein